MHSQEISPKILSMNCLKNTSLSAQLLRNPLKKILKWEKLEKNTTYAHWQGKIGNLSNCADVNKLTILLKNYLTKKNLLQISCLIFQKLVGNPEQQGNLKKITHFTCTRQHI